MAFQFRIEDGSARKAVRRIATEQIEGALTDLRDSTLAQAAVVHSMRKRTKKLRGLLRLIQPGFPGFKRENAVFRDAAGRLAGLRDAQVMRATFESVAADSGLDEAALAPFRAELDARIAAALHPDATDADLAAIRESLLAARDRARDWTLNAGGFDLMAGGLAQTLARAGRALGDAETQFSGTFDAEPFHEWRKHVKAHWYQARLLFPIWPEMMAPHIAAADALGELLGDHNDRDVLILGLAPAAPAIDHPEAFATLQAAALAQRRDAAARALVLGRRLLAGSPDHLVARWQGWWKVWRAER